MAKTGVFLSLIVLIFAACTNSRVAPDDISLPTPLPFADLIHTHWTLTEMKASSLPEDMTITLNIDPIRFFGSMGCNDYSFDYEVQPNGQWRFVSKTRTVMNCPEFKEIEDAFLSLFSLTRSYEISGDTLTLKDSSGRSLLYFLRQPMFTPEPDLLMGQTWQLEAAQDVRSVDAPSFTIRFDEKSVQISTTCSTFIGIYQMKNDRIRITGMRTETAKRTCAQGAEKSEKKFLNLLSGILLYRIQNDRLFFYSPKGEILMTFKRRN